MSLQASFSKRVFTFNFKARTSRGLMKDKTSWFLEVKDDDAPETTGIGECGPLPGLSPELDAGYEETLARIVDKVNAGRFNPGNPAAVLAMIPAQYPSILFGFETALLDFANGGKHLIFDNDFVKGEPISINGLIWMGDMDFMMDQINKKIAEGFKCLKLKVGGLDFDKECDILDYIRKKYFRKEITIRLDANGAFKTDDVLYKLEELSKFEIHSIEQPIKPGLEAMEELCRKSPIPVAFDEELISITGATAKKHLLEKLNPRFIVLKPTLHGGFKGCDEWISIAESLRIGWWITSALESGIGLNAICQFTANYKVSLPQGLGTGAIYTNGVSSPLTVADGRISYDPAGGWEKPFSAIG
jgi:o-succinylbenzoate synthase